MGGGETHPCFLPVVPGAYSVRISQCQCLAQFGLVWFSLPWLLALFALNAPRLGQPVERVSAHHLSLSRATGTSALLPRG